MACYRITKGRDIQLKGEAKKEIVSFPLSQKVALQSSDFCGLRARLVVKETDPVKIGSPILVDKDRPQIKIVSPASGKVAVVVRGEKRILEQIIIETDGRQETAQFTRYSENDIPSLSREKVRDHLLEGGLWPVVRERPFSKIADPEHTPKSIFIHAMDTQPLAGDIDFILKDKEKNFQLGLDIIKHLTTGKVHLSIASSAQSKALTQARNVEIHQFKGPHPAGNVSTHIHFIDPINKGEVVWYIEAQDVLRIAELFVKGIYSPERIVAVTGEGAKNRVYAKTVVGAPLSLLLQGSSLDGMRCLSGSILTGKNVGKDGYLCFYDSQITVIPEGGKREFLGWLAPGFNKYTLSKTFVSSFIPVKGFSLNTDEHGSHREIVMNHIYDSLVPLDIYTYFLIKAILAGDIEEAEKLGILECDVEDFALCTFACPSKFDVSAMIQKGLETIEREG